MNKDDFSTILAVKPGAHIEPPKPLTDYEIKMIQAGLMVPKRKIIRNMAREIRKWRGDPNPDLT